LEVAVLALQPFLLVLGRSGAPFDADFAHLLLLLVHFQDDVACFQAEGTRFLRGSFFGVVELRNAFPVQGQLTLGSCFLLSQVDATKLN